MRTLPWDWHTGGIPDNVELDETAYLESSYSFDLYRSEADPGMRLGKGASVYLGTMFDIGPAGHVSVGECALLNGIRVICDHRIEIGDHALISWNVVLMDTYRIPKSASARRAVLTALAQSGMRRLPSSREAAPIRIGNNVWIGFDTCILPGVSIGEGVIVGARSVVAEDVPPYSIAVGNPARIVRTLNRPI